MFTCSQAFSGAAMPACDVERGRFTWTRRRQMKAPVSAATKMATMPPTTMPAQRHRTQRDDGIWKGLRMADKVRST